MNLIPLNFLKREDIYIEPVLHAVIHPWAKSKSKVVWCYGMNDISKNNKLRGKVITHIINIFPKQ